MRRFPAVLLVGLLLGAPVVAAQAPQKKVERAPRAEGDLLAAEDMNRAVQLTDGFANEAARVSVVIAVARSVLVNKS